MDAKRREFYLFALEGHVMPREQFTDVIPSNPLLQPWKRLNIRLRASPVWVDSRVGHFCVGVGVRHCRNCK